MLIVRLKSGTSDGEHKKGSSTFKMYRSLHGIAMISYMVKVYVYCNYVSTKEPNKTFT